MKIRAPLVPSNSKIKTELNFLAALEQGEVITQMTLSKRIGVAVGLVNALLKRAVHKGYVKAKAAPYKRYAYYLTPQGFAQKSRLVAEYLETSLEFFRVARQEYADLFTRADLSNMRRVAFVGGGELAEIALMAARDAGIDVVAMLDSETNRERFCGVPIVGLFEEVPRVDGVVITDSRVPQAAFDLVRGHFAPPQILVPQILRVVRTPLDFKPRVVRTQESAVACRAPQSSEIYDLSGKRIWVAGHRGMVGSAIVRRLAAEACEVLTVERAEADLTRQGEVDAWLSSTKPDAIILAAAKVGGIHANQTFPAQFLYDNLMIEANIIQAAHRTGTEKLLLLGSSCIYPRAAAQPIAESALLTGPLEKTNEWYAIAKIAGIKLCQAYRQQYASDFISAMPTNLYGPGDNFHPEYGHVPAALLRRFHEAKVQGHPAVTVWGTGAPRREFLHVDDLADACVFLMKHYSDAEPVNVGTGIDIPIREFAEAIKRVVGYEGDIVFDSQRPDGTPRKVLNVDKLNNIGWRARISLEEGLERYYTWFLANQQTLRN